eukprot:m51a1_g104 hypothetical protein (455) ;mRNA; f:322699-324366
MALTRTAWLFFRENWVPWVILCALALLGVVFGPAVRAPPPQERPERGLPLFSVPDNKYCPVVDAVYLWVNGTDPQVQSEIARVTGKPYVESGRLRDIPTLKYSMRALDTFAPWVRRVVLVTNGQKPTWLDESNPRVRVVAHREIFEDPESLPTFNSNAIEAMLANLKDIAPCWFYLNDDFFFGRNVRLTEYLELDTGRQKLAFDSWSAPEEEHMKKNIWHRSVAHSNTVINSYYHPNATRVVKHNYEAHNIRLIQKRITDAMYQRWKPEWLRTATNKFREEDDMAFPFTYNNVALEEFGGYSSANHAGNTNMYGSFTLDKAANLNVYKRFRGKKPLSFCLNDGAGVITTDEQQRQYEEAVGELVSFFEEWFPYPSSLEKVKPGTRTIPLTYSERLRLVTGRSGQAQASTFANFLTAVWIVAMLVVVVSLMLRAVKAARHKTMFGALGAERDLEV